jgi:hypothetical protein
MDVCGELHRHADRLSEDPLPVGWRVEPALIEVGTFGELLSRLRRLDRGSDEALRALARLAAAGEAEACLVVTVALLPLLIVRCDRRPAMVVEAVNELAARVSEPAHEPPSPGVANRLLRRVEWRVRHDRGYRDWQVPVHDLDRITGDERVDRFETEVVDRVALAEFRHRLASQPEGRQAWDVLVASTSGVGLSSTDRSRLAKHRRALRRLAESSLVA